MKSKHHEPGPGDRRSVSTESPPNDAGSAALMIVTTTAMTISVGWDGFAAPSKTGSLS